MRETRNDTKFWLENLKGRHICREEDNVKTHLGEIGYEDVDWILLTQDRYQWRAVVNTVLNLRFP
jgi:hypothetical protein